MTDESTKPGPIVLPNGEMLWRCYAREGKDAVIKTWSPLHFATEKDLLAAGFVPLAELERVKGELGLTVADLRNDLLDIAQETPTRHRTAEGEQAKSIVSQLKSVLTQSQAEVARLTEERSELRNAYVKVMAGERATVPHGQWYTPMLNDLAAAHAQQELDNGLSNVATTHPAPCDHDFGAVFCWSCGAEPHEPCATKRPTGRSGGAFRFCP